MSAPSLQVAIIETLMTSGVTRWSWALVDESYKMVWLGGAYATAEDAKAAGEKRLREVLR